MWGGALIYAAEHVRWREGRSSYATTRFNQALHAPLISSRVHTRLKILFVSPYLPSRHSGAPVRLYGLVKALAAAHEVSVLAFVSRAESPEPALAELRKLSVDVVTVRNDRLALHGLARRALQARTIFARSFRGTLHDSRALQSALTRMTDRSHFDVIQLEHCFMAGYAYPPDVPVVLDEHNIEYEIPLRSSAVVRGWPRKAYDRLEYQKLRAEEEGAWRQ